MHQAALSVASLCFSWSSSNNYAPMKTAIKTISQAHNEINAVFKPRQQFNIRISSSHVYFCIVTKASDVCTSFLNNRVICDACRCWYAQCLVAERIPCYLQAAGAKRWSTRQTKSLWFWLFFREKNTPIVDNRVQVSVWRSRWWQIAGRSICMVGRD